MRSSIDCPVCSSRRVRTRFQLKEFNVMVCPDCTVQMLSNLPSETELEALYSHDYYESRGEYYFNNPVWDPEHGKNTESMSTYKHALERLRHMKPDGKTLLDVGCGLSIF